MTILPEAGVAIFIENDRDQENVTILPEAGVFLYRFTFNRRRSTQPAINATELGSTLNKRPKLCSTLNKRSKLSST